MAWSDASFYMFYEGKSKLSKCKASRIANLHNGKAVLLEAEQKREPHSLNVGEECLEHNELILLFECLKARQLFAESDNFPNMQRRNIEQIGERFRLTHNRYST